MGTVDRGHHAAGGAAAAASNFSLFSSVPPVPEPVAIVASRRSDKGRRLSTKSACLTNWNFRKKALMASGVSFAQDILPLFTDKDIAHMQPMNVLLNDYSYMSQPDNAGTVYDQVSAQQMPPPPEGPWSPDNVALFKAWMDGGFQP
jgi:hypothetical protein